MKKYVIYKVGKLYKLKTRRNLSAPQKQKIRQILKEDYFVPEENFANWEKTYDEQYVEVIDPNNEQHIEFIDPMNEMAADKQIICHTEGMENNLVEISMAKPQIRVETKEEKEEREELMKLGMHYIYTSYNKTEITQFARLFVFERKEMLAYNFYHHDSLPMPIWEQFLKTKCPILFDDIYKQFLIYNFENINENLQERKLKSLYQTWQDKCNKAEQFLFLKY